VWTSDYDPTDETANEELRRARTLQAIEALIGLEELFPATEQSITFHEYVHIPDHVFQWNNVRNFWCFFFERMNGFIKRLIHNRRYPHANLAKGMHRIAIVRGMPLRQRSELDGTIIYHSHSLLIPLIFH
jgi:hypothetical protein